nr:divergent PAP2 family [uncultured bacterium]
MPAILHIPAANELERQPMKIMMLALLLAITSFGVMAQQPMESGERRVPLTDTAVALDAAGASALEGSLRTTALNGTTDSPVTNIRMVVKNSSTISYALVSGLVTFYDASGVRCGEGLFKADALAVGEAFETDTPGIRIRCSPATWRIIATNLLPRIAPVVENPAAAARSTTNLLISIDGEEHPLQIDRPLVLTVGNAQRTIVVRAAP